MSVRHLRPIVLVAAPGSGQEALLGAVLSAPGVWDGSSAVAAFLGDRSAPTSPEDRAADLVRRVDDRFRGADWSRLPGDAVPRVVLSGTALATQVQLLDQAFPDAVFVRVHRAPEPALMAALGDQTAADDHSASEHVAEEWAAVTAQLLDDLQGIPESRCCVVGLEGLMAEPAQELQRVFAAVGLGWHQRASERLQHGLDRLPQVAEFRPERFSSLERVRALGVRAAELLPEVSPSLLPTSNQVGLTAVDDGLAGVLTKLGSSLLVSTYQTNRLMSVRAEGERLAVHLRAFDRPMGITVTPGGFALGVGSEVLDFRDTPELAAKLEPRGLNDAFYLPRNSHVTGDVAIHDLAMGRDGLWVVATSFSCLATLDTEHSFVPQWKPPFVSALAPEDRCHLNGVALVDGVPRYVTALGTSDEPGGWRAGKADGGVVLEVPSGNVVASGLSMPHSPRWHDGRLWVLESGHGRLIAVDPSAGSIEVIAELPGFTRGMSIHEGIAFVGTSQARETATFGGLPINDRDGLTCGVWAVDLATGAIVGSVRFEDRIQEVFEVAVLPGVRHPEIAEPRSKLARTSWVVPGG